MDCFLCSGLLAILVSPELSRPPFSCFYEFSIRPLTPTWSDKKAPEIMIQHKGKRYLMEQQEILPFGLMEQSQAELPR